jgi:hypothetical protein
MMNSGEIKWPLSRACNRHLKGPLVFCTGEGRMLKYTELRHPLWRACRKAGLRAIQWHALRHSFASHRQGAQSGTARNTTTVVELVATVVTYVGPAAMKCVAVVAIAACELKLDVGTRSAAAEPMPVTPLKSYSYRL